MAELGLAWGESDLAEIRIVARDRDPPRVATFTPRVSDDISWARLSTSMKRAPIDGDGAPRISAKNERDNEEGEEDSRARRLDHLAHLLGATKKDVAAKGSPDAKKGS